MLQMVSARHVPAINDNISTFLAAEFLEAMAALRDFRVPDRPRPHSTAAAFDSLRLALFSDQMITGQHGARQPRSRRQVDDALERLAAAPCVGAADLAMKALSLKALSADCQIYAARRQDRRALADDVETLAEFLAIIAADALALAAPGGAL